MNSVFVQCELWCDEILRKITRPICSCARHAAAQMSECHGHGYQDIKNPTIRGVRPIKPDPCPLTFKECPAKSCAEGYDKERPCPASLNITNTYLMYSSSYDRLHSLGTVQPLAENTQSDLSASASEELLPRRDYSVALESLLPQRDITTLRLEPEQKPHVSWSTPKVQTSDSSFHSARSSNGFSSVKSAHSADFKVENTLDAAPSASKLSSGKFLSTRIRQVTVDRLILILKFKIYDTILLIYLSSLSNNVVPGLRGGVHRPDGRLARTDGQLRVEHPGVARLAAGDPGPGAALPLFAAG